MISIHLVEQRSYCTKLFYTMALAYTLVATKPFIASFSFPNSRMSE